MNDSPSRPSGLCSTATTTHSLDQFRQLLTHYLLVIGQQYELLLLECSALRADARLWSDQRQRLQRLLTQHHELLLSFRSLLEQPHQLPEEVISLRDLPLLFLQNAESQTRHLLDLLASFPHSEQERAPARQRLRQHQALLQGWEQLLHYYDELIFHLRLLSDQMRFLLRRLSFERQEDVALLEHPMEAAPAPESEPAAQAGTDAEKN
ncbi:hypothetical protein [Thermogemmatispora sp.]|uniref:hypothetical protein n=1 Tax=Thermogemmatispora sp. TaxID=1968838 RepID=UPI0035E40CC7